MKKALAILVGICLVVLNTGCFDIVEEVFLNKDGSGKYLMTMDMSGLLKDSFMKGMFEESLKQEGGDQIGALMEKDSIIYFKDLPEVAELSAGEKEILENLQMRLSMSEKKSEMLIKLQLDFKNVTDINKMSEVMSKIGADQQVSGGMPGGNLMTGNNASFSFKKGLLSRLPVKMSDAVKADENMEMMKMFLGDADYKTIYHLPGKVKKADIPGAVIEGNTVTVTNSLLDMMDGKAKIDGAIKFK